MKIKGILRQYFFSLVVIFTVSAFFLGTVSVREKTQYNMDMTPYGKVEIVSRDDEIVIRLGEKEAVIDISYAKKLQQSLENTLDNDFFFDLRQIFT